MTPELRRPLPLHTAIVVGGGLAGLTVAKKLAEQGVGVTVLEGSARTGGKAGADVEQGRYREHGYHIFPAWYRNVRAILAELGVPLVDFDRWHYLKPGHATTHPVSLRSPDSFAAVLANLRAGFLPPDEMALYFYFVLDMLAEPLSKAALLDQVSRLGLLRSRWYATEHLAQLESENIMKASAIPMYELSAMTAKIISANWMRSPRPLLSILPGDLQRTFIEPYAASVEAAGARIELDTPVQSLEVRGHRIAAVHTPEGRRTADLFVIATPLEVTRRMIGAELHALDPALGNMEHLQAAPMASLHLTLKTLRSDFPPEHVFLQGGRYGLSFIDLTPHWPNEPTTTLSFIASNFIPLRELPENEQYASLMAEIGRYLRIDANDVEAYSLKSNTGTPLFINTIGAWPNRPKVHSHRVENLYFAGDWVQNPINLACMEGAVSAALAAAHAIGKEWGLHIRGPAAARTIDPRLFRVAKWALLPAVVPLWLSSRMRS